MIHPTAVIHPKAQIHPTVRVGPYAVIDEHVLVGPHCVIGPHVFLTGLTTIGEGNHFYAGCVVGEAPQDLKYKGEATRLQIGDQNTIREHVTINRSTHLGHCTTIGSHNQLMAHCHLAHDVSIGDHVTLVNGCLLAGHVTVGDRAVISGNCLVHQFVRIGTLAMMQGGSAISKDLPPYTMACGDNHLCGLNTVGLRRAGFSSEQRLELRRLYHALFRSGRNLRAAVASAKEEFSSEPARAFLEFVASTKRGICGDAGGGTGATESED